MDHQRVPVYIDNAGIYTLASRISFEHVNGITSMIIGTNNIVRSNGSDGPNDSAGQNDNDYSVFGTYDSDGDIIMH